jgi:predicted transcriptional regulator of viral defense system
LATRYTKAKLFIRLKRDCYVLSQTWSTLALEQMLGVANVLQVPSYVSFMTALGYHGVTTQVQRDFFESAALKRSARFDINGIVFNYYKLRPQHYFDFTRQGNFFISTREKAFVDAVYLYSFGKYRFDLNSLALEKLDKKRIKTIGAKYPAKTLKILRELCAI